jgi:hypothetical protein
MFCSMVCVCEHMHTGFQAHHNATLSLIQIPFTCRDPRQWADFSTPLKTPSLVAMTTYK